MKTLGPSECQRDTRMARRPRPVADATCGPADPLRARRICMGGRQARPAARISPPPAQSAAIWSEFNCPVCVPPQGLRPSLTVHMRFRLSARAASASGSPLVLLMPSACRRSPLPKRPPARASMACAATATGAARAPSTTNCCTTACQQSVTQAPTPLGNVPSAAKENNRQCPRQTAVAPPTGIGQPSNAHQQASGRQRHAASASAPPHSVAPFLQRGSRRLQAKKMLRRRGRQSAELAAEGMGSSSSMLQRYKKAIPSVQAAPAGSADPPVPRECSCTGCAKQRPSLQRTLPPRVYKNAPGLGHSCPEFPPRPRHPQRACAPQGGPRMGSQPGAAPAAPASRCRALQGGGLGLLQAAQRYPTLAPRAAAGPYKAADLAFFRLRMAA
jgi:hypothetical protein